MGLRPFPQVFLWGEGGREGEDEGALGSERVGLVFFSSCTFIFFSLLTSLIPFSSLLLLYRYPFFVVFPFPFFLFFL